MEEQEVKTGNEELELSADDIVDDEQEAPFWLQEEEPDSSGEEDEEAPETGGVPVAKHVQTKKKLKAKLSEKDDELSKIKEELEQLKNGQAQGRQQDDAPPKRPRRADFDDEDAFEDAMDKYEDEKIEYQTQYVQKNSHQNQQQKQRQQQIDQAVDDHYSRAEKLVEKHSIKPEIYQQSDATVKGIIKTALPKLNPEVVFNGMVELLGEGSEITMFHIGRNKEASNEFSRLLQSDPSGLKASAYLGRIAERVSGAKANRNSQAPAPAAKLKGDEASSAKGQASHKKWADAHKKGRSQEAYNIKQAAKKQGIDVSSWK